MTASYALNAPLCKPAATTDVAKESYENQVFGYSRRRSSPSNIMSCDVCNYSRKVGGRLVTVGSDAHIAERVGLKFAQTLSLLRNIGFDAVYRYDNHKPIACKI